MKTFKNVEQIKTERQAQRDNPVIYSLLGVIIGELDRLPTRTNPTEDQIYTVIKKMYESTQVMSTLEAKIEAKIEAEYLEDFIRKQLSEEEILNIITGLKANFVHYNIGMAMKYFKDNYPGQYDGKLVSKLAMNK